MTPIRKVVALLSEMKTQVEKEATEDEQAYEKYECWCSVHKKEKGAAVIAAEGKMAELEAFIERAAGLEAQLKSEIANLADSISADKSSLEKAVAGQEQETKEFYFESKDKKESIALLDEAMAVLTRVQLLQHPLQAGSSDQARPLLLQLKGIVGHIHSRVGRFRSVMQRDLWDAVSSLETQGSSEATPPNFRGLSTLEQKREDVLRREPEGLIGSAAGAKSYNSRSGQIVGIISQLKDEFQKNLGAAQKEHLEGLIQFHSLRSAKMAELAGSADQKMQKEKTLAKTLDEAAHAKEDLGATKDALSADQRFLLDLEEACATSKDEYAKRSTMRAEELKALTEAIAILDDTGARDLLGKTLSFLQTDGSGQASVRLAGSGARVAARHAAGRLLRDVRRHGHWALASLAAHLRLDAFTDAKMAMDKMLVELRAQQKEEAGQRDFCMREIDEVEDNIGSAKRKGADLQKAEQAAQDEMLVLEDEMSALKSAIADLQKSLKQAGEDRKGENELFQQSVGDQRTAIQILKQARERLRAFYVSSAALPQLATHGSPPPPRGPPETGAYAKSAGAAGVLQLLDEVLRSAARAEADLVSGEQRAQRAYEAFARDCVVAVTSHQVLLAEKTERLQRAAAAMSEAAGMLASNTEDLERLEHMRQGAHLSCDYLLMHYETRQKARMEEMEAITEAKAILAGADFASTSDGAAGA
eukprot:CAMPEP_0179090214 /NCGR_PEP_ID=MMETSP0796-20121207/41146_1 /TAXON_ID=73915 /ORGANISM="Pyrodinium bahamense, Strain pbaha01" /LENGTH=702 /DNA_ID=CAMNT_0020787781 /DNA_START=164 /DNA_END=2272 /DNA_ORIENTATION=-